ncbi:MAG: hypothetical protein AB1503_11350 [Bacillota bacterium]
MSGLAFSRLVAMWSDRDGYRQATDLAEKHRDLLGRRLSPARLNGLLNAVAAAAAPAEVQAFVRHQVDNAGRREEPDLRQYWLEVGIALRGLEEEANRLATLLGEPAQDAVAVEEMHLQLIRRFVQHLVVHSLYLRECETADRRARDQRATQRRR